MVLSVGIFSFFANLLLLSGPLYMLQIYDRVLATRSIETLVGLSVMTFFLLLTWGALDFFRGCILARIASGFRSNFDRLIGTIPKNQSGRFKSTTRQKLIAHADSVENLLGPPLSAALADVIWVPIFLVGLAMFHPLLCVFACLGIFGVVLLHRLGSWFAKKSAEQAGLHDGQAKVVASQIETAGELSLRLDDHKNLWRHWLDIRRHALFWFSSASDVAGFFDTAKRTWKLTLQSAMLGLGAFLVLSAGLSPGAMVAATILLVRALGPVETLAVHWLTFWQGVRSWRALEQYLHAPQSNLSQFLVTQNKAVSLSFPSQVSASDEALDFKLDAGEVLGIIGASGAGKTEMVLATLARNHADQSGFLANNLLYLPSDSQAFSGSIVQNISGFKPHASGSEIASAAQEAGISEAIARLDDGYHTDIGFAVSNWPRALQFRLGLARAILENPEILILDDPFSTQPPDGVTLLADLFDTRSKAQKITIFTARTPMALTAVHKLIWLENGKCRAFGTRDSVLARYLAPRRSQQPAVKLGLVS